MTKGIFGPGILGQEQFEKEKFETTKGRGIFGPGILGDAYYQDGQKPEEAEPENPPAEAAVPDTFEFPPVSIPKLKDLVIGNPEFLESAIETEFQRDPEPRRGALRFFLEELEDRERPDLVSRVEEALSDGDSG